MGKVIKAKIAKRGSSPNKVERTAILREEGAGRGKKGPGTDTRGVR